MQTQNKCRITMPILHKTDSLTQSNEMSSRFLP